MMIHTVGMEKEMPGEEWRKIPGYEAYQVSNYGRVKSSLSRRGMGIRKQQKDSRGYMRVGLQKESCKRVTNWVHRIAAVAWVENALGLPEVDHKDGDKANNRVGNLEWVTHVENLRRAVDRLGGHWMAGKRNR